jgi:hypothetical protein
MYRSVLPAAVCLLVVLAFLIAPGAANHTTASENSTGPGAVQVHISLAGTTAENVTVENASSVQHRLAAELGVSANRIFTITDDGATDIEVRTGDISPAELATALNATNASFDADDVREGVTSSTRSGATRTIGTRLRALDHNGTVIRTDATGIVVRVSSRPSPAELDRLVLQGNVSMSARLPDNRTVSLLSNGDFDRVGQIEEGDAIHAIPVELTRDSAARFSDELVRLNFTTEGVNACEGRPSPDARGYCLVASLDGEPVAASGITEQFAASLHQDQFVDLRRFWMITNNASTAHDLRLSLVANPLPTNASIQQVTDARDSSVTQTATPTPTPMPTPTPSPTATITPAGTPTETPGGGGPGFTPLLALGALAAGLLALRDR